MYGQSKKLLACWILLGSVLASIGSYGQTPTPTESTDKPKQQATTSQKKPKPDQRGTEKSPLFIKVVPTQKTQDETEKETQQQEEVQSTDRWLMRFTGLLAIFTLILAGFTAKTWWDAKKTAERQLRAYVGCGEIAVLDHLLRGEVHLKNFGKTMAKEVEIRIAGAFVNGHPITNFPLGNKICKTVLMPNEVSRFDQSIPIAGDDLTLLAGGTGSLYVWGRIDYKDVFGEQHWTMFRFMTEGRRGGIPNVITGTVTSHGWKVNTCQEGNDAD